MGHTKVRRKKRVCKRKAKKISFGSGIVQKVKKDLRKKEKS